MIVDDFYSHVSISSSHDACVNPTCTVLPEAKTQTNLYLIQTPSESESATIEVGRQQADTDTNTEALWMTKPGLCCGTFNIQRKSFKLGCFRV